MPKNRDLLPLLVEASKLRRRRSHIEKSAAAFGSFVEGWAANGDFAREIANAEAQHEREVRRSELWVRRYTAASNEQPG
jgi:hypothetical protein